MQLKVVVKFVIHTDLLLLIWDLIITAVLGDFHSDALDIINVTPGRNDVIG